MEYKQKKLIIEYLFISILLFFSSCKTLVGGGFFPVITENNLTIASEIAESGIIVYDQEDLIDNTVCINNLDFVTTRWFYGYRFRHKYKSMGSFCYNGMTQPVKLIFDFYESGSEKSYFGDIWDLKGRFWNIDVEDFSLIYHFETISEQGIMHRDSAIDTVYLKKDELPIVFVNFFINNNKFSVLLDKSDNESLFNIIKKTYHDDEVLEESGLTRIRDLMTDENQKYLICDSENHICAEFTRNWYVLYASEDYDYKSLIPAIGVYAGIIRLMNMHYEYRRD